MNRRLLTAGIAALALAATTTQASTAYRWTDAQGRAHYADRVDEAAPAHGVERIAAQAEAAAVARLRVEPADGGALAWVDNLLAGPIEVMLHADGGAASTSDPALPARGTVQPHSAALLARIGHGNPRLRVIAVPGSPNARPRDVEYAWPLPSAPLRIQQAWGGGFSHDDAENRHAVDFAAPVGTPVVAARDGVVMQAEAGFDEAAPGEDEATLLARANFIRVLHDDGTMALYAHLQAGGVLVRVGQLVRRGQAIGRSGNTGHSTAPHLHFVVQANRGMRLASVPFRMFGPEGILRFGEASAAE
ncbi:M23 family metallopeptidase [Luteimonas sp. A482]